MDLAAEVLGLSDRSAWTYGCNPYALPAEDVRFTRITRTACSHNPYGLQPQPVLLKEAVLPKGSVQSLNKLGESEKKGEKSIIYHYYLSLASVHISARYGT